MDVNGMKITDVVVYEIKTPLAEPKEELIAFAKVVLNDRFLIHGIRIYENDERGVFMVFPQGHIEKTPEGIAMDICHPTSKELKTYIDEQVMAEFALTVHVTKNHENQS